ncbi:lactate utilization protein [Catenisphaera adipataccumulans]|jgi:hypothetical protein|uniref:LUD domain-containing protein n=1 Tax=Catenisphaera adipataccumulans TaxID=700500 RepID=A0A7W8CWR2_9FIRM|nr:lactate utilization protein [Catenisphaera adipataccumulans]MBB5182746.1 hypothetical protein [Catenisphaera adipataccumulans]
MKSFDKVKKALEAKGYQVKCFDTAKEAADALDAEIDQKTVGFGGSVTLDAMGLYERLQPHNEVYWHWRIPEGQTAEDMRKAAAQTELYICSANGLSEDGMIINIDGYGNRIASTLYGHQKVIFVIGENKLAPTFDEALARARNIAAPKNAQRLHKKTPCSVLDKCADCQSPERICRILNVLWDKPTSTDYEVILIHEDLGY